MNTIKNILHWLGSLFFERVDIKIIDEPEVKPTFSEIKEQMKEKVSEADSETNTQPIVKDILPIKEEINQITNSPILAEENATDKYQTFENINEFNKKSTMELAKAMKTQTTQVKKTNTLPKKPIKKVVYKKKNKDGVYFHDNTDGKLEKEDILYKIVVE